MEIGLLKAFQHIEVVALNVQVLCGVEVHTLLRAWAQRGVDGGIGSKDSLALVGPSKLVALFVAFYNIGRQQLAQLVKVNGMFYPPPLGFNLCDTFREQFGYSADIVLHTISGLHF